MPTVQSYSKTSHSRSSSSSIFGSSKDKKKKDKRKKRRPFNLEAEKEQMKATIADSSMASINLMNTLKSINREKERISDNRAAVEGFEKCKQLRRRVLRYVCVNIGGSTVRVCSGRANGWFRFIMLSMSSGSEACSTRMTSSSWRS